MTWECEQVRDGGGQGPDKTHIGRQTQTHENKQLHPPVWEEAGGETLVRLLGDCGEMSS